MGPLGFAKDNKVPIYRDRAVRPLRFVKDGKVAIFKDKSLLLALFRIGDCHLQGQMCPFGFV